MPRTRTIAIANQKGGTCKTTTATSLAYLLAQEAPTLAVDCDPQGNMTQTFGIDPDAEQWTVSDVLEGLVPMRDAILALPEGFGALGLVPANARLATVWQRVTKPLRREEILARALREVAGGYRFVILDCPPSLDETAISALVAADEVVMPADSSRYSLRGLRKLTMTLEIVREVNTSQKPPRFLVCRAERTRITQVVSDQLRGAYGDAVYGTHIPKGKDVPESQMAQVPLPYYAPSSPVTKAYAIIAREILNG